MSDTLCMTNTTDTATRAYYRTAKGSHRHADWTCANTRRSIQLGDVTEIPAGEIKDWAACDVCCTEAEVAASIVAVEAKAEAMCKNSGVRKPRHIESECLDCGKRGKVNRATGSLRAHRAA